MTHGAELFRSEFGDYPFELLLDLHRKQMPNFVREGQAGLHSRIRSGSATLLITSYCKSGRLIGHYHVPGELPGEGFG